MQHQSTSTVAILLSTYNGAAYLPEQLDSLAAQTCRDWVIYASDDGSQDDTVAILHDYQRRLGKERLVILKGPRQGFAANFLATLKHANGRADFFAFCDQDDFWEPEKLERGLSWAQRQEEDLPALYCSRTRLIDAEGRAIGYSPPVPSRAELRQRPGAKHRWRQHHAVQCADRGAAVPDTTTRTDHLP